jgi:hypothetical protein
MKLGRISSHARIKMKRQGMSEAALEGLLENGRVEYDGVGGRIVYLDPAPTGLRARTERHAYAVLDGAGEVITIGCGRRSAARGGERDLGG